MLEKVEKTIRKFRMLDRGDRILIGVSGGPDSVCLVYVLKELSKTWKWELSIAHLNHKLRDKDSDEDANFVQNLAERLTLPFYHEEIDTNGELKKRGLSEEGARVLRYEFFWRVAKKIHAEKIALGHTKDDQVETVLMRLIKGAGLLGLKGIPPVRDWQGLLIVRPLFEIWRDEVVSYLKENKIGYRIDTSNITNLYLRNRIRNELLPHLAREFNPKIKEVLANMAESLGTSYEYLNKVGQKNFRSISSRFNGKIMVDLAKIKSLPLAIQREIFRQAIKELKGNLRRICYQHWKEFASLLNERPVGAVLNLPRGIWLEKKRKEIIFQMKE